MMTMAKKRTDCMRENLDIDTKTLALYYAWDHFAYHAQQRQTVFNFFLLLVGGCVAAYSATIGESGGEYHLFPELSGRRSGAGEPGVLASRSKEMRGL